MNLRKSYRKIHVSLMTHGSPSLSKKISLNKNNKLSYEKNNLSLNIFFRKRGNSSIRKFKIRKKVVSKMKKDKIVRRKKVRLYNYKVHLPKPHPNNNINQCNRKNRISFRMII